MSRESRESSFIGANVSSGLLFIGGALLFPAFLFQQDIVLRAVEFGIFLALNVLSGKQIRWLQYLVVSAGIVVFNLVIPTGRVLVSVIGLPVTEGALKSGLLKALAMSGLIALSQFSIRSDLRLPGKLGGLIARSLFYFERIMGERRRIERRDIIGSIDRLLLDVQAEGAAGAESPAARPRATPRGVVLLAVVVLVAWGALAFTMVHPHPIY
ncbi:MAG TPA: hypothetical protein VHE79_07535 [Spirochaetia bacterium]